MTGPSPEASVLAFDARPITTHQEFTLPVIESRYDEAMADPDVSDSTRMLRAFELICSLREALHGSAVAL